MQPIGILCFNKAEMPRSLEPVSVGVPIRSGVASDPERFTLRDGEGQATVLQTRVLNRWPDGSVKWLLCDFLASTEAGGRSRYSLEYADQAPVRPAGCTVESMGTGWRISTGSLVVETRGAGQGGLFSILAAEGTTAICQEATLHLRDLDGSDWPLVLTGAELEAGGPVRTTLAITGQCSGPNGRRIEIHARLRLYAGQSYGALELRLHNPQAARHPGNLWDLGDPGSVILKECILTLPLAAAPGRVSLHPTAADPACPFDQGRGAIYQESSGGVLWQSPVHRNREGMVPMREPGWVLTTGTECIRGHRAQPVLIAEAGDRHITVGIDHFWQRFPKALCSDRDTLRLELFPGQFPGGHELQGGEQVTELIRFDCAGQGMAAFVAGPRLLAIPESQAVRESQVFPEGLWEPAAPPFLQLLAIASGPQGFAAKREQVDEYGWRNFGELYADHEAALDRSGRIFVSHYNNQYDPLASMYKLALATGGNDWLELARDLAAHVADIDINHTDLDREEYCHGLFWHTDHYLDAGLSTHRMASREHLAHKNPAFCGGGPAAEHCYTTGLALHHLLSGDPRSRQLVLELAEWCFLSLRGPQTLGAALLRAVKNLKRLRHDRNSLWPRFPLSRGTGNCLNAALDAFELTGEPTYLARAAELIQGTVHPGDQVDERQLLNAEMCWSYTVFFASVGRYLAIKKLWGQMDGDFSHARASLLAYGRWMVEHEYPYLDKPEELEYPNETWAGQDLRKGVVLYYAASHAAAGERERMLEKAAFFLEYGLGELCRQESSRYTRPLALVLQNGWAMEAVRRPGEPHGGAVLPEPAGRPTPRLNLAGYLRRTAEDLAGTLLRLNLQREWRWLRTRLAGR